jgi:hypothetical protein
MDIYRDWFDSRVSAERLMEAVHNFTPAAPRKVRDVIAVKGLEEVDGSAGTLCP